MILKAALSLVTLLMWTGTAVAAAPTATITSISPDNLATFPVGSNISLSAQWNVTLGAGINFYQIALTVQTVDLSTGDVVATNTQVSMAYETQTPVTYPLGVMTVQSNAQTGHYRVSTSGTYSKRNLDGSWSTPVAFGVNANNTYTVGSPNYTSPYGSVTAQSPCNQTFMSGSNVAVSATYKVGVVGPVTGDRYLFVVTLLITDSTGNQVGKFTTNTTISGGGSVTLGTPGGFMIGTGAYTSKATITAMDIDMMAAQTATLDSETCSISGQ